jgi:hypothetical protein
MSPSWFHAPCSSQTPCSRDAEQRGGPVTEVVIFVLSALIVLPIIWRFVWVVDQQLFFPFDLVYESPILTTARLIKEGVNPYSPSTYNAMPFALAPYPPLYHSIVALFPVRSDNPFFYGRLVTLVCVLGCAVLPWMVCRGGRRWPLCLVLSSLLLGFWPLVVYSTLVKVDQLALLLSASAVVVVSFRSFRGRGFLAAALCFLSLASKQSYVASAASCLLFLWFQDRREALRFLATCAGLGAAGALCGTLFLGRGFWFCIVATFYESFDLQYGLEIIAAVCRQPLVVGIAAATLVTIGISLSREGIARTTVDSPYVIYLVCSGCTFLMGVWKIGSARDYSMEVAMASVLWLSHWCASHASRISPRWLLLGLALFAGLTGFEILASQPGYYRFADPAILRSRTEGYARLKQTFAKLGLDRPKVLNLETPLDGYTLADRVCLSDPGIYYHLWTKGILSAEPLARVIDDGVFDLVVTSPRYLSPDRLKPYERKFNDSLRRRYRYSGQWAHYIVFIRTDIKAAPR